VAIYATKEGLGVQESVARFRLARALVAAGGDRARALREATAAHDRLGDADADADAAAALVEVEAWLAAQAGPPVQ